MYFPWDIRIYARTWTKSARVMGLGPTRGFTRKMSPIPGAVPWMSQSIKLNPRTSPRYPLVVGARVATDSCITLPLVPTHPCTTTRRWCTNVYLWQGDPLYIRLILNKVIRSHCFLYALDSARPAIFTVYLLIVVVNSISSSFSIITTCL